MSHHCATRSSRPAERDRVRRHVIDAYWGGYTEVLDGRLA